MFLYLLKTVVICWR